LDETPSNGAWQRTRGKIVERKGGQSEERLIKETWDGEEHLSGNPSLTTPLLPNLNRGGKPNHIHQRSSRKNNSAKIGKEVEEPKTQSLNKKREGSVVGVVGGGERP